MKTKNILLFTVTIVYFFISYDVIDLPYKIIETKPTSGFGSYGTLEHYWEEKSTKIFHSKLFGDIPIRYGDAYTEWSFHTPAYIGRESQPVEKMWILPLINWYKAILIGLLYCSLFLSRLKKENEEYFFWYFAPGIIWSICTLFNLSLSYGLSEIIIIMLLAINFMPKSNKN